MLIHKYTSIHVVQCTYKEWKNKSHTMVRVYVEVFKEDLQVWNALFVKMYGEYKVLESNMKLIDAKYLQRYPQLLNSN